MMVSFAKFISLVLNPLTVAIFAPFVLVYRTTGNANDALHWMIYTLIFSLILGSFVLVGVKKKIFTDFDVSKREQRPLMFLISILFCVFYLVTIFAFRGPFILSILAISIIVGISCAYFINKKTKASMHVAVITAFTIPVATSYRNSYLLLLLLIPLVGWARVIAKRHTVSEVITGGFVGAILSLSIYIGVKVFTIY